MYTPAPGGPEQRRNTAIVSSNTESGAPSLDHVRIVLVGTTHPGNIGATARAMKVMGLSALHLVAPARFPSAEATARAAGADDILARARVHADLEDALVGVRTVYGTTARERHIDWPAQSPREAAAAIAADGDDVAIVFGRERSGLTNEELDRCQRAIHIPTSATFRSLNLAQAVQICAYELRLAHVAAAPAMPAPREGRDPPAAAAELEGLRAHTLAVMEAVGYYDPAQPKLLERRLQRLFNRAGLLHSESQILRGFLAAIAQRVSRGD